MAAVKSIYKPLNKTELFILTKPSLRNYNDGMVQKDSRESLLIVSFLPDYD